MAIRVALTHRTTYRYDRLISLSPHEVRLRPGSYQVRATKDGKPVVVTQELIRINKGEKQIVKVTREVPKELSREAHGVADFSVCPRCEDRERVGQTGPALYFFIHRPR